MNREALKKTIDNLSMQMIYLHSTNAYFHNGFDPLIISQQLEGQFKIATNSYSFKEIQNVSGDKHRILVYRTEARMRYLRGPIPDELKND
ncbi:MAG: hypothetical protein O2966_00885 [Proteobacteria bacterium]|nr:hypothetical protein [Pseudomonadota bacterium]